MIKGALAIFERDLRKFVRTPVLLLMSVIFPLVFLIIFGNALGGTIDHIPIGVTQEDLFRGETPLFSAAMQRMQETETFDITLYRSEEHAKTALDDGAVYAAAVFPAPYRTGGAIRLYIDSSEYLIPSVIESGFTGLIYGLGTPADIEILPIYGEIEYFQFFGVAVIVLAIFTTTMFGGGNTIIMDREMGIIEGYLTTPVKRSSIVLGMIGSGTVKAMFAASIILIVDVLIAGVIIRSLENLILILFVLLMISLGITSFIISFASRFESHVAYSALVAFFNLLLFITSGAFYPHIGMPDWLTWVSWVNPEFYSVHALRCIILRGQGLDVVYFDLVMISVFSLAAIVFGITTFRRTLE
ncbi:MAG: ABC transporter permease [Methanomicrobiaceae archaeon]|nr:ABC transporter permease [Methanomicrobiaceae archaeon]